MNEDIAENITYIEQPSTPSLEPGFRTLCMRIGAMMIVVLGVRCISTVALTVLYPLYFGWSPVAQTLLQSLTSIIFLNVIPIAAGISILKFNVKDEARKMYAKPRYFGRALGMFPAGYSLSIVVASLTMLILWLIRRMGVTDSAVSTGILYMSSDMTSAMIMFFHKVVIAPLFEEFWFRGMVLQSLRPYGNGFAIFVSSLLFGITHANLEQFFYTTAIGIILGYVAVQTGSVITSTVMHAMFNSVGAIASLFIANPDVVTYYTDLQMGYEPPKNLGVILLTVWSVAVMLFAVVGAVMAVIKFIHIKRYRVPKVQTELSAKRRWGIFLSRPTVVIMLLMALDTMTFLFVTRKLIELLAAVFYP